MGTFRQSNVQSVTVVRTASLSFSLGSLGARSTSPSVHSGHVVQTADGKTGADWLDGVVEYCKYRLARIPRSERSRNHPLRQHYNGIIYAANSVRYWDENRARVHMALPVLNPSPALLPHELDYQEWRRDSLAAALVAENPNLTDYRLLKGLPKNKLARLLAETRKANAAAVR